MDRVIGWIPTGMHSSYRMNSVRDGLIYSTDSGKHGFSYRMDFSYRWIQLGMDSVRDGFSSRMDSSRDGSSHGMDSGRDGFSYRMDSLIGWIQLWMDSDRNGLSLTRMDSRQGWMEHRTDSGRDGIQSWDGWMQGKLGYSSGLRGTAA